MNLLCIRSNRSIHLSLHRWIAFGWGILTNFLRIFNNDFISLMMQCSILLCWLLQLHWEIVQGNKDKAICIDPNQTGLPQKNFFKLYWPKYMAIYMASSIAQSSTRGTGGCNYLITAVFINPAEYVWYRVKLWALFLVLNLSTKLTDRNSRRVDTVT